MAATLAEEVWRVGSAAGATATAVGASLAGCEEACQVALRVGGMEATQAVAVRRAVAAALEVPVAQREGWWAVTREAVMEGMRAVAVRQEAKLVVKVGHMAVRRVGR